MVRVSNHPAAVLLRVDGFSLAALHGVDQGHAPAARNERQQGCVAEKVSMVIVSPPLRQRIYRLPSLYVTPTKLLHKLLGIRVGSSFKW